MPIVVPQTVLDEALAADKKRRGILDIIPADCFTIKDLIARGMNRGCARAFLERHAIKLGRFGNADVYRLKENSNGRRNRTVARPK